MSGTGLFVVGLLVTLIVMAALALLLYAAVLDGRAVASPHAVEVPETQAFADAVSLTSAA